MNPQTTPNQPSIPRLLLTVTALVISYALLQRFGEVPVAGLPLQRLSGPIMLLLGALLLGQLLSLFLTGGHLPVIKGSLMLMAWTVALVRAAVQTPSLRSLEPLEQPIIWLVGVFALYRIVRCWTQESEILETALQVTALTGAALLLSRILPKVWPTGRLTVRLPTGAIPWSISQAIVFALLMVAAFRSASLIRLAENKLLRMVGETLRGSTVLQFIAGTAIFLYAHDLRPTLAKSYGDHLGLLEWGAVAVILAVTLERLRVRMKRLPDGVTVDQLARHLQDVSVTGDDELTMVARLMAAFVERGERSGIVTYLIAEAACLGVSVSRVQPMAAQLLEHDNVKSPGLTTRWEGQALARRNREQRLLLLQSVVEQFDEIIRTMG